jgi:hypothetical protein
MDGEIKSKLNTGNACCQFVKNVFSFHFLANNTKTAVRRTLILSIFVWVNLGLSH